MYKWIVDYLCWINRSPAELNKNTENARWSTPARWDDPHRMRHKGEPFSNQQPLVLHIVTMWNEHDSTTEKSRWNETNRRTFVDVRHQMTIHFTRGSGDFVVLIDQNTLFLHQGNLYRVETGKDIRLRSMYRWILHIDSAVVQRTRWRGHDRRHCGDSWSTQAPTGWRSEADQCEKMAIHIQL